MDVTVSFQTCHAWAFGRFPGGRAIANNEPAINIRFSKWIRAILVNRRDWERATTRKCNQVETKSALLKGLTIVASFGALSNSKPHIRMDAATDR